ncbi:hypothetical protein BY996DRAFT_6411932 [Phakopsora pachyrhizi]|nr:hypothetical protein BY996DRAFT_6411932 [Phakopsora pachyrhizi]
MYLQVQTWSHSPVVVFNLKLFSTVGRLVVLLGVFKQNRLITLCSGLERFSLASQGQRASLVKSIKDCGEEVDLAGAGEEVGLSRAGSGALGSPFAPDFNPAGLLADQNFHARGPFHFTLVMLKIADLSMIWKKKFGLSSHSGLKKLWVD